MVVDLCDSDDVDSSSADADLLQSQLEGIMMELSELLSPTLAHAALLVSEGTVVMNLHVNVFEKQNQIYVRIHIYTHRYINVYLHLEVHGLSTVRFDKSGLKQGVIPVV